MKHFNIYLLSFITLISSHAPSDLSDRSAVDARIQQAAEQAGWFVPFVLLEQPEYRQVISEIFQEHEQSSNNLVFASLFLGSSLFFFANDCIYTGLGCCSLGLLIIQQLTEQNQNPRVFNIDSPE